MRRLLALSVLVLGVLGCADDPGTRDLGAGDAQIEDADAPDLGTVDLGPTDMGPADAGPAVDPLSGAGAVEILSSGYMFTEGPVWDHASGVLLFSDIPANAIFRFTPPDAFDTFRPDSGNANGLAFDRSGLLLAAEHGHRRVSITQGNGTIEDFTTEYMGNRLNSPNDLVVRSDGTVYFTDPPYGLEGRPREISFNGVFRKPPGGALVAEWQGPLSSRPNGIALSPDETKLYVADTADGTVSIFDAATNGSTSNRRPFVSTSGNPDGMAIDADGNLFVTTASGVEVYAPEGVLWGTILVPEQPANCAFGSADGLSLFITAQTTVYEVRLSVPGLGFR